MFVLTTKKEEARLELTVLMCKGRDHTNPATHPQRKREKKINKSSSQSLCKIGYFSFLPFE